MGAPLTEAFVHQFDDTLRTEAQQKESRLAAACLDRGDITGSSFDVSLLGSLDDDSDDTERFGDTVLSDPSHSVRIAVMVDYYRALGVVRADEPKVLANPSGPYTAALTANWNRWNDKKVYRALLDPVMAKDGSLISLPSTQKILHGSTGITKGKLIEAKAMFRANECDEMNGEELYIAYNAAMLQDILSDTTLTSADFMAIQMLQAGKLADSWLGFKWLPYEALDKAAGVTTTVAWAKSGIHKGKGFYEGKAQRRADKKDMLQLSAAGSMGFARAEEVKVVAIEFQ